MCPGAANLRSMVKPLRPYDLDQRLLLPPDLREWLPDDDLALFVSDTVDGLDLSAIPGTPTRAALLQNAERREAAKGAGACVTRRCELARLMAKAVRDDSFMQRAPTASTRFSGSPP